MLEWFNNIDNIKNKCFVNFDIINFYPSISHEHLSEAITFAKIFTEIKNEDIQLIEHTCKTIVTYDNRTWIKKDSNSQFDVPMGSFFGAELCDLVGLYALSKLRHLYNYKDIELYRDDGLAIISRKSNQELERLKKNTIKIFNELGFSNND